MKVLRYCIQIPKILLNMILLIILEGDKIQTYSYAPFKLLVSFIKLSFRELFVIKGYFKNAWSRKF